MKIVTATACLCLIGPSVFVTALCTQARPSDTARQRPVDPESRTTATDRGNMDQPASGVRFAEVTLSAGIHFQHFDPVTDKQFISETIGSGAGWIDIDGDGHLDLVLINSAPMPNGKPPERQPINHVYRNRRDGSFEDVTGNAWSCPPGFGQGCAVGDSDNDGFDDLYVSYYLGANRLFHNNGDGTFRDVSTWSGTDCPLWSTSCAWGDLDGDGDLDLYVCNYLDMPLDRYPYCGDPRHKIRTVCSPVKFAAQSDAVYCNGGEGRFTDATQAWGFRVEPGRALGVVIADLDGDRLSDVYVANDRSPNLLFRNLGGGRFQEQGLLTGSALSADGMAQAGMGVDAGDVDGDGRLDLFVTNFFHEPNSLFRNDGSLAFREISARSGLGRPSFLRLGFGCGLFDVDNDGHLDVFVANGHVDRNPEIHGFAEPYRQPAQLFLGNGRARFAECDARTAGEYFEQRHVGRAAAFADYDNDGRMDIAVNHNGESAALLKNESSAATHWLRVALVGVASNRNAMGSELRATVGERMLTHQLVGGRSYLAAHDLRPLIGIGTAKRIDQLEIRWPSGVSHTLVDQKSGRTVVVREPRNYTARGHQ